MNVLVLNAGSASLKFEVIAVQSEAAAPDQCHKLVSGSVEGIGDAPVFSLLENERILHQEKIAAADYGEAARQVIQCLRVGH